MKANPCDTATNNLSGAVDDGRKKLSVALKGYRKSIEVMQAFRDNRWNDFQEQKTPGGFSLADFPKSPPLLPANDYKFIEQGSLKK